MKVECKASNLNIERADPLRVSYHVSCGEDRETILLYLVPDLSAHIFEEL